MWDAAGLPYKPRGRDSRAAMTAELRRGSGVFLVAEASLAQAPGDASALEPPHPRKDPPATRIVGSVFGTHDGRKGWINRLAVAPDFRGRGLARRLVGEAEQALRSQGIDVIAALIESQNRASLGFFAGIGWVHDPDIEYFSTRSHPES